MRHSVPVRLHLFLVQCICFVAASAFVASQPIRFINLQILSPECCKVLPYGVLASFGSDVKPNGEGAVTSGVRLAREYAPNPGGCGDYGSQNFYAGKIALVEQRLETCSIVQRAFYAQQANASAILVGNNLYNNLIVYTPSFMANESDPAPSQVTIPVVSISNFTRATLYDFALDYDMMDNEFSTVNLTVSISAYSPTPAPTRREANRTFSPTPRERTGLSISKSEWVGFGVAMGLASLLVAGFWIARYFWQQQHRNKRTREVRRLKTVPYLDDPEHRALYFDTSACAVCLEEFTVNGPVLVLPSCRHVFHLHCVKEWLSRSNSCPICKISILSSEVQAGPPGAPSEVGGLALLTNSDDVQQDLPVVGWGKIFNAPKTVLVFMSTVAILLSVILTVLVLIFLPD